MDLELIATIASASAAVGSAAWAWSSARSAKRALALAETEATARNREVSGSLVSSLKWRDGTMSYASFACTYCNRSTSPTTVERFELRLHLHDIDGNAMHVLVSPSRKIPPNSEFQSLPTPLNLPARETTSGWLTFELPGPTLRGHFVDKYEILAVGWDGKSVQITCHVLVERVDSQ